jgi:drug/metabolite transporter (DMT)-like permease
MLCRVFPPGPAYDNLCMFVRPGRESARVNAESSRETRATDATRRERIPLGILYMIAATILFAGNSAISKWLVDKYPIGEVIFTRSLVSLIVCSIFILPQTGLAVFRTQRLGDHIKRGISQSASQTCIVIAFLYMPLAGAVAITFSAPLFATLLSVIFLREPVGFARGAALIVGFLGVVLVTNPGADTLQIGALFALGNAVLYATVTVAVRGMTSTESTQTLTMYQMVLLTAFLALLLPFGVVIPTWQDGWLMVFAGLINALGQYWWTRSLHLAPASAVTPFYYLSLVWAVVFGFLIWGDVPTIGLVVGSSIVVASGLYLLWREARR